MKPQLAYIIAAIASISGSLCIALWASQSSFFVIVTAYLLGALGMFTAYKQHMPFIWIVGIGLVARLIFFVDMPQLSDDYHRFFWDGAMVRAGLNPYTILPVDICCEHMEGPKQAFQSMNSPDKYTLYPPLSQLIFALLASWEVEVFVSLYRLLFLAGDVLAFLGLRRVLQLHNRDKGWAILYFLHPAVLTEGVGNLHVELLTVPCLIWAYFYYIRGQLKWAWILYIVSVSLRILPLIFLPFLIFRNRKTRLKQLLISVLAVTVLFSPVWLPMTDSGFLQSLNLYFTNFEFNASVYYVLRYLGQVLSGYNLIGVIGPVLAVIVLVRTTYYSYIHRFVNNEDVAKVCASILLVYLLFSTTVHPWYVLLLLPVTIVAGYWYGVIWSVLAVLSYSHYMEGYQENYMLIALEYILLGILLFRDFKGDLIGALTGKIKSR